MAKGRESLERNGRSCFIIGPIGEAGSLVRREADALIDYIIKPELKDLGFDEPDRADRLGEPGRITSQIVTRLKVSALVIADLTGGNANVYYELSLRHALGLPIIHMATDGTILPFDVRDHRTIFYSMDVRRVNEARKELAGQINKCIAGAFKPSNPIVDTIEIVTLQESKDTTDQALGTVLQSVEQIRSDLSSLRASVRSIELRGSAPPEMFTYSSETVLDKVANSATVKAPAGNTLFTQSGITDLPRIHIDRGTR